MPSETAINGLRNLVESMEGFFSIKVSLPSLKIIKLITVYDCNQFILNFMIFENS